MERILTLMLVLSCNILIGKVAFAQVAEVEIKSSWQELTDTATVTLPKNVIFKSDKTRKLSDTIKRGDQVVIQLGYDGRNEEEFRGYVTHIDHTIPVRITCEDEMWKLKQRALSKSWAKVSTRELVRFIAPDHKAEVVDINLSAFQIDKASPARVLQTIKEKYGLVSFFRGDTLVVGFPYRFTPQSRVYVYDFQKNVAGSDLQYKGRENSPVIVKAISNLKTGKKLILSLWTDSSGKLQKEYTRPDGKPQSKALQLATGETRTLNFPEMGEKELEEFALAEMEKLRVEGYSGDITGFGRPVVRPSEVVRLVDNEFADRQGRYFVDGTAVRFGVSGFRREVTIGKRAS